MIPCAYLRIFEPLTAFPAAERERWRRYVDAGGWLSPGDAVAAEGRITASRLVTGSRVTTADGALVRRDRGRVRLCPLQLDLRTAFALHEFRQVMPDELVDAFVDRESAQRALAVLDASSGLPHIKEAPWAVPLEWFALFLPDEREQRGEVAGTTVRTGYATTVADATARVSRALRLVTTVLDDAEEIVVVLEELAAWLGAFTGDGVIELDYGGVAGLLGPEELAADQSCADVVEALGCLAGGDVLGAAARYGVARGRWTRLRARERVN